MNSIMSDLIFIQPTLFILNELLSTVPGIGKALSMTIALETGDIGRFKIVGNYASYCRCVPSNRISNSKSKGKKTPKTATSTSAGSTLKLPIS